jgi:hypothetical protein
MSQLSSAASSKQMKKCAGCGKEGAQLSCSACHSESYCSSSCQRTRWLAHKAECKQRQAIQTRINEKKQKAEGRGVGSSKSATVAPLSSDECRESYVIGACFHNQHKELQILLQQQSRLDISWADPDTGCTAVHASVQGGHDMCLSLIIQYGGADLAKMDNEGHAPIHKACNFGRIACLLILLDHGCDANLPNADGSGLFPVMFCTEMGHVKCLNLLLDRGANINQTNFVSQTAAHVASGADCLTCLKLLIARGADFNGKDACGNTPLDCARHYGARNCLELLLENKAIGKRAEDITPLSADKKVRDYLFLLCFALHCENLIRIYCAFETVCICLSCYNLSFLSYSSPLHRHISLKATIFPRHCGRTLSDATTRHATPAQQTRT